MSIRLLLIIIVINVIVLLVFTLILLLRLLILLFLVLWLSFNVDLIFNDCYVMDRLLLLYAHRFFLTTCSHLILTLFLF